jgi:hypothetical protein
VACFGCFCGLRLGNLRVGADGTLQHDAQRLALRPLSTIHQDAVTTSLDEKARMVAFGRRNACRRPQEGEREHSWPGVSYRSW